MCISVSYNSLWPQQLLVLSHVDSCQTSRVRGHTMVVSGAFPVTTNLIMRVNARTTTTTTVSELVSAEEASTRTLIVLDVDGWKHQFNAKNVHTGGSFFFIIFLRFDSPPPPLFLRIDLTLIFFFRTSSPALVFLSNNTHARMNRTVPGTRYRNKLVLIPSPPSP